MAVNIVVAIGGTGSRAAEAFVYAAATGLLNNTTETHVFIADKDIDCGNTQRLGQTLSDYKDFRSGTGLTMPEINKQDWIIDKAMFQINEKPNVKPYMTKPEKFRDVVLHNNDQDDIYLADLMHSPEEQNFKLDYGFYGHPSLGAAIYAMITQTSIFNDPNSNELLKMVNNKLAAGEEVYVFLYGSVFGGTGASLFPNVARSLHNAFRGAVNEKHLHIGGALMLPYFSFGNPAQDQNATVKYGEFMEKTAVALSHYAQDGTLLRTDDALRDDPHHQEAVFDAMYLFGSLPLEPTCAAYALGGADQTHTFAVADLYAALAAVEFFNNNVAPLPAGQPHLFTAPLPAGNINWNSLPNANIQAKAEQMVCFCDACLTVLHPMFLRSVDELRHYKVLIHLFGGQGVIHPVARLPQDFNPAADLERIAPFCLKYLSFWQNLHNRNSVFGVPPFVSFFIDNQLVDLETYLYDPATGSLPTYEWFEDNYIDVLRHFKPNELLLEGHQRELGDSLALQNALNAYDFDINAYPGLLSIYRATYDLMH